MTQGPVAVDIPRYFRRRLVGIAREVRGIIQPFWLRSRRREHFGKVTPESEVRKQFDNIEARQERYDLEWLRVLADKASQLSDSNGNATNALTRYSNPDSL